MPLAVASSHADSMMLAGPTNAVARGRALAQARAAVTRAQMGEAHVLEVQVPPRPILRHLLDDGALGRAIVLLERDGEHGRIAVLPRVARGAPTIAELLEEDHRRLDDIADRMRKNAYIDPMRAVVLANLFAVGITRHVRAEEAILFPIYDAYEAQLGRGRSSTGLMEREHRAILHYVERLLRAAVRILDVRSRDEATEDLLRAHCGLVGVLEDHNDKEERALFPVLDRMLFEPERLEVLRRLVLF
jgi:hemerythrin-like domain-containing protein